MKYIYTENIQRDNVKIFLKDPKFNESGFTICADVFALNGNYEIGIADVYKGKYIECSNLKIPVEILKIDGNN